MWNKILSVFLSLFWAGVIGYLLYKGLYAVVILSAIVIGMGLAFTEADKVGC